MSKTTDNISTTCVLCSQNAKLFAVGPCDHPICAKCSTRMRVLCEQKYCAVCRNDMVTVIFLKKVHPYASIISHKYLYDKKAGIRFSAGWMKNEFEEYLCHRCPKCPNEIFKTMKQLEEHVRRKHELFYCNLCLENVKVFTSERPLYNRTDLAVHKRKGDRDNTSYRGHPLCEFCDVRFFDNDELLKHLRRQHYFCHFCENDGISHQYYDNYDNLRQHFKEQHYLCEEDGCINEEFTAAFRTEIDLKAHKASKHTGKMSRKEAKQARQLDWEFSYTNPRANHREGVVTGADYNETHASLRGRGRGARHYSNREIRDTERAIESSLQPDATKEQRPPKRRDKPRGEKPDKPRGEKTDKPRGEKTDKPRGERADRPRGERADRPRGERVDKLRVEKTDNVQQETIVKHEEKKQRPVKEDEFEKRRAAAAAIANPSSKNSSEFKSKSNNQTDEPSDWSTGNKLTSCQFTESTWTNEGEKSPKVSKSNIEQVEEKLLKEIIVPPKNMEVEQSLNEADFPSLGKSSVPTSAPGWSRVVPSPSDFPSLGSAAKPHKPKPTQNGSYVAATSIEQELKVDFSKAITANKMMYDKKKRAAFKQAPQPPPPPTQSYKDFPTLSSIANILSTEPHQTWAKNKQAPSKAKNTGEISKAPSQTNQQANRKEDVRDKSGIQKSQNKKFDKGNKAELRNGLSTNGKSGKEEKSELKQNHTVSVEKTEILKAKEISEVPNVDSDCKGEKLPPGLHEANAVPSARHPPGFMESPSNAPPGFNITPDFNPPPGFKPSEFIEPRNFKQRNIELVEQIQLYLNYDSVGFNEFKRLSGQFRQGYLSADIYYKSCSDLLGRENFQSVFPDLVALLPDTIKQQELLLVNNDYKILAKGKGEKVLSIKKKGNGSSAWNVKNQNTTCLNCGQVLLQKDLISHADNCSSNTDFPSLGAASAAPRQTSAAWGRVK